MNVATEKILQLMEQHKIKALKLEKDLSLASSIVSQWKNGRQKPSTDAIMKIAEYFNVTTDYLLGRTDLPANATTLDSLGKFNALPVIGSISAGYNGEAVEEYTGDMQEIPASIMNGYSKEDVFILTVKGDSMYPDFYNGDKVLVKRQTSVDSGSVAVVLYNGNEATLKKVVYEKGKNWLDMVPRNPEYQTKRIAGADLEECHVLGKVIYLFRKYT